MNCSNFSAIADPPRRTTLNLPVVKIMLVWKYGSHFFRNEPAILRCLPVSGARADTYPALRAARRHPRQTCRLISKSATADTEMRSATISRPQTPGAILALFSTRPGVKSSRAQPLAKPDKPLWPYEQVHLTTALNTISRLPLNDKHNLQCGTPTEHCQAHAFDTQNQLCFKIAFITTKDGTR